MLGRTIGKYRVVEALGRGGMGTVYKAVDETLDREVAIKVLNADLLESDGVKRFRSEAVTLAKLNHPRIAQVYELTRDGENLLMVMEFAQGETFEHLVARTGALPIDRAVTLAAHVLDALQHAHHAGVVHRDLKPANLMLTPSGDVKVMDFGIARVQGTEHLTSSGSMMGTPAYMAPEQVRGDDVDARTDVYAMGVVLYRMVTGQLPFKADTAIAMVQKQLNDAPTPSRQFRADIPAWLDEVLRRALAKTPADRFQTADDLRLALLQGASPGQFMPTQPPTLLTPAVGGQTQRSAPEVMVGGQILVNQTTVTLQKRHLAGVAAVLGLLVVGGGALAFFILRSQDSQPTASPAQVAVLPAPAASPEAAAPIAAPVAPVASGQPTPAETPPPAAPAVTPAPRPASAPKPAAARPKPPPTPAVPAAADPASAPAAAPPPVPAAAPESPPISFTGVKMVLQDGDKLKEHDVVLKLEGGQVWAVSAKVPSISKSIPYRSMVSATYSRSKHPRWKEGIGVAVVAGVLAAPMFFMKSTKHWLTLQSKDDYVLLHLDKNTVSLILPAIESRTGISVRRLEDGK